MKFSKKKNVLIVGVMMSLILLFTGCSADALISEATEAEVTTEETLEIISDGDAIYEDGTYTGIAQGFGEDLTVEVVVKDNLIVSIDILSHNEHDERYYGEAMETLPGEIIAAQDPIVDIVSGATFTSTGIMNATIDALSQALVSGDLSEPLELPENSGHRH